MILCGEFIESNMQIGWSSPVRRKQNHPRIPVCQESGGLCGESEAGFGDRKQVKKFLVSFIPRYVSNRVLLGVYHMLAAIPVPRKNRDKNYDVNMERLSDTDWDFWTVQSAYIENQYEWDRIMFGSGAHHNMRHSGCEIMATFNALKVLTGITGSPESMAALIREYEAHGAALRGEFGVSPRAIEAYFKKRSFLVTATHKGDEQSLDIVDRQSQVLIATVYNDAEDITRQVHTVCITKDAGKGYVLHNAYCRGKDGKYVASAAYATLLDAVCHASRYGAKVIYLIGVAGRG